MDELIPGGRTREEYLDEDAADVEVAKYAGPEVQGLFRSEEPEEGSHEEREHEMADSVW